MRVKSGDHYQAVRDLIELLLATAPGQERISCPVWHRYYQKALGPFALELYNALSHGGHCDLILVLDDLDCHDAHTREKLFSDALDRVKAAQNIKR